jgi:RHS repeat-associated protein
MISNYKYPRLCINKYTNNENVGDFRDQNTGNKDYAYWPNGNLMTDLNEGISTIEYDSYLNQPTLITLTDSRTITYQYDGAGRPLATIYSNGETWDYAGGIVYKKAPTDAASTPYQIATAEGRYIFKGSEYEYDYKDHLGNTRLSFKEKAGKLIKTAETSYDPWGIVLQGIGQKNNPANRWELQGKEKESTFGLNRIMFGARTYNATIGRFDGVDPLADKREWLTPYNFAQNNPINRIDPDGKLDWPFTKYLKVFASEVKQVFSGSANIESKYYGIGLGAKVAGAKLKAEINVLSGTAFQK